MRKHNRRVANISQKLRVWGRCFAGVLIIILGHVADIRYAVVENIYT
jgi:hypothetical protein